MAEKKYKVTFKRFVQLRDHNREVEFEAKRGQVVELCASSRERWMKRGAIVDGDVDLDMKDEKKAQSLIIQNMTIPKLKEFLTKHKVKFNARDNRTELIRLALDASISKSS